MKLYIEIDSNICKIKSVVGKIKQSIQYVL